MVDRIPKEFLKGDLIKVWYPPASEVNAALDVALRYLRRIVLLLP
jgi:hypothetical protein